MNRSIRKRRSTIGIALALIVAGVGLIFGPTLAINLWDAHIARLRAVRTAQWMAKHLRPTAVPPRTSPKAAETPVIAPGGAGYLLEIPRLGLRLVVHMLEPVALTGVPTPVLTRYGLGQIPYTTALRNVSPGGDGTTAIAGHRTTHGAPFRHLDTLKPGDLILVRKGAQVQQWVVEQQAVIAPTDVEAIRSHPGVRRLVLLACTPPFSAKSRLMISARLAAATAPTVAVPAAVHQASIVPVAPQPQHRLAVVNTPTKVVRVGRPDAAAVTRIDVEPRGQRSAPAHQSTATIAAPAAARSKAAKNESDVQPDRRVQTAGPARHDREATIASTPDTVRHASVRRATMGIPRDGIARVKSIAGPPKLSTPAVYRSTYVPTASVPAGGRPTPMIRPQIPRYRVGYNPGGRWPQDGNPYDMPADPSNTP
jgi:sortase A